MKKYWTCDDCHWIGEENEILVAPNPFEPSENICGCPKCKSIDTLIQICEHEGCKQIATGGTPTKDGYGRYCYEHFNEHTIP